MKVNTPCWAGAKLCERGAVPGPFAQSANRSEDEKQHAVRARLDVSAHNGQRGKEDGFHGWGGLTEIWPVFSHAPARSLALFNGRLPVKRLAIWRERELGETPER